MASVNLAIRLQFEPVRSLGYASIGAGYMGVGTAIANPGRQFFIQNLTDVTLMFSLMVSMIIFHFPLMGSCWMMSPVIKHH